MARSFTTSNTLPHWEAKRLQKQQRKEFKAGRNAYANKRNAQDAVHKTDTNDMEIDYREHMEYELTA